MFDALDLRIIRRQAGFSISPSGKAGAQERKKIHLGRMGNLKLYFPSLDSEVASAQLELEQLERRKDYNHFRSAMETFDYFSLRPDLVIEHETDPEVLKLSRLTAKYMCGELFKEFGYSKSKRLTRRERTKFSEAVRKAMVDRFAKYGISVKENWELLGLLTDEVERYVHKRVKIWNGYFPENSVEADANLVSAAVHFSDFFPGYSGVRICTADTDVLTMHHLYQTIYGGCAIPVECDFKGRNGFDKL